MSPKTGRPKVDNPNSKNLTVRINEDLALRLEKYCDRHNLTKGEVVRIGIKRVLTENE